MVPLKLAIVGSGPSAFYAASRILSKLSLDFHPECQVHIYEKLPVPYGLVRYGVAPDHPEVKNCIHKFEEIAQDSRFKFFGNVTVAQKQHAQGATQITLPELSAHYNNILIAHGASSSRTLDVVHPLGKPLKSFLTALDFVNWYNGHPYAKDCSSILKHSEHITVIGMGNVALDCARIILKGKQGQLDQTDIPAHVLHELHESSVKRISIVGRRGPSNIAFTTKELRELTTLPDIGFTGFDIGIVETALKVLVDEGGLENRAKIRMLKLLHKSLLDSQNSTQKSLNLDIQFNRRPISFDLNRDPGHIGTINWRDSLSDEEIITHTDGVIQSIGYTSTPIDGINFNAEKAIIDNIDGRVAWNRSLSRVYTCGWAARGPVGVIAESMFNAYQVADHIIADTMLHGNCAVDGNTLSLTGHVVDWEGWKRIDSEEKRRGLLLGKEREKIWSMDDLLELGTN